MSRTPPRLKSTFSARPLSKINLKTAYAEIKRPEAGANTPAIPALVLGRAFDAAARNDADFFIDESSPILVLGDALSEVVRRSGDYSDLVRHLEKHDVVEISVALDRMRKIFSPDPSSPAAVVKSVSLSSELLACVRPDVGLDDKSACHVLTHAALEAYYLRGASARAKNELDLSLNLIHLATGVRVDFIQPEKQLELGLEVWEAWQGVQALEMLFGLRAFATEMERRGEDVAAGLALGAEVLLRSNARKLDLDALSESLSALEQYAAARGRKNEQDISASDLGAAIASAGPALPPELDSDGDDTLPDVRAHLPLARTFRETMTATPAERAELARAARRKARAVAAIVEDILSVIERFEILMHSDDHSLVLELAPMLERSLRVLYGELELFHPTLEAAIYSTEPPVSISVLSGADGERQRNLHALRVLVSKAADLIRRSKDVGHALVSGAIEVGFRSDVVLASAFETRTEEMPTLGDSAPDPALRGRAEALLLVMRARDIEVSEQQRSWVMACTDRRTIDLWLERAANARDASEVFG